jgi:hypothetical protein
VLPDSGLPEYRVHLRPDRSRSFVFWRREMVVYDDEEVRRGGVLMDSTRRKGEDPERTKARFAMLQQGTPPNKREEPTDLPRWVKSALVFKEVYGESYNESAERFKRTGATLSQYAGSPAGKKWREQLTRFADDPIALAEAMLKGNALNITLDRIMFLEGLKEAGDFVEADKIARDLQDRIPELAKKTPKLGLSGGILQIVLPAGAGMEPLMVATEHKLIEEAEFTVVDSEESK